MVQTRRFLSLGLTWRLDRNVTWVLGNTKGLLTMSLRMTIDGEECFELERRERRWHIEGPMVLKVTFFLRRRQWTRIAPFLLCLFLFPSLCLSNVLSLYLRYRKIKYKVISHKMYLYTKNVYIWINRLIWYKMCKSIGIGKYIKIIYRGIKLYFEELVFLFFRW